MRKTIKFMLPILFVFLSITVLFVGYKVVGKYYTKGPDDADIIAFEPKGSLLAQIIDTVFGGKPEETALYYSDDEILAMTSFEDTFSSKSILEEGGSMGESKSKNWWLNSGGQLIYNNGIGETVQGKLSNLNRWRIAYKIDNPEDTDNGYHPQNIFRLVTRSKWKNFSQQVYFRINADNLSSSSNRNESNGLLLFNRYQSGQTLYYVGLRVDGAAVIKKKYNGTYYTMAYKAVFPGKYNRNSNPDLLPKNIWIGIKSEVSTSSNGDVNINLYTDVGKTGKWTLVLATKDVKGKFGKSVISTEGYAGIRTDFMDVDFSGFKITQL